MDNQNNKVITIESCENCGRNLKDEWQFCPYCKKKVDTISCPYCREDIKKSWDFCPFCKRKPGNGPPVPTGFEKANDWLRSILNNK